MRTRGRLADELEYTGPLGPSERSASLRRFLQIAQIAEAKALIFKSAAAEDFDRLYAILLENSAWLKERAIPQWDPPYPAHRFRKELADGQIVYFEHDDQLAGTVTIFTDKPDYYPGDLWTDNAPAWYLFRLAVRTGLRGRGFGRRILAAIEAAASERHIEALRLDIVKANPFLESYYQQHGFRSISEAAYLGTTAIFMEKRLTPEAR